MGILHVAYDVVVVMYNNIRLRLQKCTRLDRDNDMLKDVRIRDE